MTHHPHFFRTTIGLVLILICAIMLWLKQRPVVLPVVGIILGTLLVAVTAGNIIRSHGQQPELSATVGAEGSLPIHAVARDTTHDQTTAFFNPATAKLTVRPVVSAASQVPFNISVEYNAPPGWSGRMRIIKVNIDGQAVPQAEVDQLEPVWFDGVNDQNGTWSLANLLSPVPAVGKHHLGITIELSCAFNPDSKDMVGNPSGGHLINWADDAAIDAWTTVDLRAGFQTVAGPAPIETFAQPDVPLPPTPEGFDF